MSAAALAQRLRNEAVPGPNQVERNGWNGGTQPVSFQTKQAATEGEMPDGTDGTGGTGISAGVGKQDNETRHRQSDPCAISSPWRQKAATYYRHHFTCKTCTAAGRGYGTRCPAGAELWVAYEDASDAAHDTNTQGRRAR